MANIGQIMKRAQEFQANMERAQKELETMEIIGESGAGLVRVCLTGQHYAKWVSIDPAAIREEKAVLEDLIAAAINSAARRVTETSQEHMKKLASGIDMSAMKGFPFTSEDKDD